ncbi:MAG: cation-translocating P-type ATPase [Acidimicrobiia bacterium]|nr:cation-translocating P-type ATPase [Acidimicrobiia bacterium]
MAEQTRLGVVGLHCAHEARVLEDALGRCRGIRDVRVDLARATVSFHATSAEAVGHAHTAAQHAGLRLVTAGQTATTPLDIDRRTWFAGAVALVSLTIGLAAQVIESGQWLALVTEVDHDGSAVVSVTAYALALAAAGVSILPRAARSLKRRVLDMHVLVVVAAIGAVWLGELAEGAAVATLFVVAAWLEAWNSARARASVAGLLQHQDTCGCHQHDAVITRGSELWIQPGARIPVDATVQGGVSTVDEASHTGEHIGVSKRAGDQVHAGSINGAGVLRVRADVTPEDSTLARVLRAAADTREGRTRTEQWITRFTRVYTPTVLGLALSMAVAAPLVFAVPWDDALHRALAIILISCPCAFVVATPVTIVAALEAASRRGVHVRGGEHLEQVAHLRAIAFDKTGVLTRGTPSIEAQVFLAPYPAETTLAMVASVEAHSEHPVGHALLHYAAQRGARATHLGDVSTTPGVGIQVDDVRGLWVGAIKGAPTQALTAEVLTHVRAMEGRGLSVVACGDGQAIWALFGMRDVLRPEAAATVTALRAQGHAVSLLSGDQPHAVSAMAAAAGIADARGGLLPLAKQAAITAQAREGAVAFVGDGINDVPAMAEASVGIAIGARATDAALETADIVIVGTDLRLVPWLTSHARRTLRTIRMNILGALAVKLVFFATTLQGEPSLWLAVLADTGITVVVTLNGLRMLRAGSPWVDEPHGATRTADEHVAAVR